mmetsp:Transcript_8250/g.18011  ORF Transcript_8250/g.18011 Transcript_8250/m.18011 type:complete len:253 (+) Transcript_8250:443-1201(+)
MSERPRPRQSVCCSSWSRLTPRCSKTRHWWPRNQKWSRSWTMSARLSPVRSDLACASSALRTSRGSRRASSSDTSSSACLRNEGPLRMILSAYALFEDERTRKTWPKVPCPSAESTSKEAPLGEVITSATDTTKSPLELSNPSFVDLSEGFVRTRRGACVDCSPRVWTRFTLAARSKLCGLAEVGADGLSCPFGSYGLNDAHGPGSVARSPVGLRTSAMRLHFSSQAVQVRGHYGTAFNFCLICRNQTEKMS